MNSENVCLMPKCLARKTSLGGWGKLGTRGKNHDSFLGINHCHVA